MQDAPRVAALQSLALAASGLQLLSDGLGLIAQRDDLAERRQLLRNA